MFKWQRTFEFWQLLFVIHPQNTSQHVQQHPATHAVRFLLMSLARLSSTHQCLPPTNVFHPPMSSNVYCPPMFFTHQCLLMSSTYQCLPPTNAFQCLPPTKARSGNWSELLTWRTFSQTNQNSLHRSPIILYPLLAPPANCFTVFKSPFCSFVSDQWSVNIGHWPKWFISPICTLVTDKNGQRQKWSTTKMVNDKNGQRLTIWSSLSTDD